MTKYIYSNHLSTATLEADENGDIISYEEYHPFGTSSYTAVNASIQTIAKRYKFTSKERDDETGLYYHGARYYISWLGRWLSADPGGLIDGGNVYMYVKNNSLQKKDNTGLSS
ncbi:MAG: RHS repeat-associated core domain-containing protein [Saprospiraceae bacterium]|nr:RHS repeat-associated core domain-containing protein [Saprospiraceae bacterium]